MTATVAKLHRRPSDGIDIGDPLVDLQIGEALVTVRSQYDGTLIGRYARRGDAVAAGDPLIEISTSADVRSNGVFISYRWADEPHFAGRLFERLSSRLGRGQVFIDQNTIQGGVDFQAEIDRPLSMTRMLIVIIGKRWYRESPEQSPRIYEADDVHRGEIRAALERKIRVLPICVDGAQMPKPDQLPQDIIGFAGKLAVRVSHENYPTAVEQIFNLVESELERHAEYQDGEWRRNRRYIRR